MTSIEPVSRRSFLGLMGAGAGALALGAAGCSAGSSSTSGGGSAGSQFQIWALQDQVQNRIQQAAINRYNGKSSSKAKLVPFQNNSYTNKLRVAMGSPNKPDVFFNWGGGSIRTYVQNGLLQDLTPVFDGDAAFKAKFLPAVLDAGKIDGKFYGVPLRGMQPVILFTNKDAFDKAGVAAPPTTWAETLSQIPKFKAAGITPFALAGNQTWTLLMWLEYLTDRFGGPEVFGKVAANEKDAWRQPEITQALSAIRDLVDAGAFASNFASVGYEEGGAGTYFAKGRAAMHLMGSWEYTNQVDQQPKFAKSGLGWATFPGIEGGKGDPKSIVGNPTNYFSITSSSKSVQGATDFLKQEMAGDAYVNDFIKAGDVPPVADVESRLDASPSPEFAKVVYNMVKDAPSFTLSWDQAIDNKFAQPMLDNLQKVFLRKLDAKGFVDAMVALQ
ncbi:MAG: xylobiose transport system substrate-binding protein [Mycobacteriales bacterium]